VPAATAVVLPPLLLEDEDLPIATLRDDRAEDAGAAHERRSDSNGIVGGCEEYLGELDGPFDQLLHPGAHLVEGGRE